MLYDRKTLNSIICGDLLLGSSPMLVTPKSTAYIVLSFYAVVVKPERYLSVPSLIIIIIITMFK